MKNRVIFIFVVSLILSLSVTSVSFAYQDRDISQTFYGTASNHNRLYIEPDYDIQAHNFYGTINFYATQGYPVEIRVQGNHGDGTSYYNCVYVDGEAEERVFSSNNDHRGSGWRFTDTESKLIKNDYGITSWTQVPKKYSGATYTVRFARTPAAVYRNYIKGKIDFNAVKAASPVRVTINVRQNPSTCSHQWGGWVDNGGNHRHTCSLCGKTEYGNHVMGSNGRCTGCGKSMHVHNTNGGFVRWEKEPTCTEGGVGIYKCSGNDGYEGRVTVGPKGHTWGDPFIVQHQTCTDPEIWHKKCVHNDAEVEETSLHKEALGHDWKSVWKTENGVENAYLIEECQRCGLTRGERQYTDHTVTYLTVDKDNNIELQRETKVLHRGTKIAGNDIGEEDIVHDGVPYNYDSCEEKVVDGEITIKRFYRKTYYVISYDNNGGVGQMGTQSPKYDEDVTLLENQFTRVGYTFKGWSKEKTGSVMYTDKQTLQNVIQRTDTGNTVTLYAIWEANKYTVHFENTEGNDVADMTVTYDQPYGQLPTPTAENVRLRSWVMRNYTSKKNFDITDVTNDTIVKIPNDHTLYGDWKTNSWKVTFSSPSKVQTIDVLNNSLAVAPYTPDETGMQFLRWSEKPNGNEAFDFTTPITEDKTLYAVFEYRTYTITLQGTGTQERLYPTTIGTLPDGYQAGSSFGGWYYDTELTQKVNSTDNMPPRDITVYPRYLVSAYNLTLKGRTETWSLKYGDTIPELPQPTEVGKTFNGWKYQEQFYSTGQLYEWDHDVELEPSWTTNLLTVAYPDGSIKSLPYGSSLGNLPTPPDRMGSKFIGFVDQKGNSVTESTKVYENTTISYKYENSKVILTLIDGDWNTNVQVEAGVTVSSLPSRSKDGYGFKGWSTYANGPVTHGPFYADTTLYASYEAGMQNIILTEINQTIQRKVGADLGNLPTPTKDGYKFDGWYNGTEKVTPSTKVPAGGLTLVPKWTETNIDNTDIVVVRYFSDGVRINTVDMARGEILYNPGEPAVSGVETRHFMYWADEDGKEYKFGHEVATDVNLYAVWR